MVGIGAQVQAFLFTFALGIGAGIIFHYYQLCIHKARVGKYWLYLLDFSLWIFMICAVFLCMLLITGGEMRVYVLIALLLGVLAYFKSLSTRTAAGVDRAASGTVKVFLWISNLKKKSLDRITAQLKVMAARLKPTPPPDDD